jgi:hypothetical protein
MRHFLCLALAPGHVPGGVQPRPVVGQPVEFTGAAQGLTPADLGAHSPAQQTLPRSQSRQMRSCAVQRPQLYSRYVSSLGRAPSIKGSMT